MKLNLYDEQMNRISIIGTRFISCLWSEGYNTVEPFSLELQATTEYKRKVRKDCYIGRDDRKTLMVIKTVRIQNGRIIVSGKQASRVLDDVACEMVIPAGSRVDEAIKKAYDASEKFKGVDFSAPHLTDVYERQIGNKTCLELCMAMCQATDVGFRAIRDGKSIKVEFYKPTDNPNNILAERYGNLKIESITTSSENFKNHAVVLGEGEGEERFRAYVDISNGTQKRSIFVDARDIQREKDESDNSYSARLAARGFEKLLEKCGTDECAFSPLAKEFGTKYDLGDVATALLPDYGRKLQARISRFTQKEQNNTTETTVEVGKITIVR